MGLHRLGAACSNSIGIIQHDAGLAAAERNQREGVEPLVGVVADSQQHRKIESGHAPCRCAELDQARGQIARRRTVQIGQDQHAVAAIGAPQRGAGLRQGGLDIGIEGEFK
jgi:hypothetical protein